MSWSTAFRPIARIGETLLDRLLCVLGAVGFAQLPEFIQQYRQRLGGHLDEARRHLAEFEGVARHAKLTLMQFIERTAANPDTSVGNLSTVLRKSLIRVDELTAAENALRMATIWERPFVFCEHLDITLVRATLEIYRPALPTTGEGLIYAVVGMVTLLGAYHGLIRYPITATIKRRSRAPKNYPL